MKIIDGKKVSIEILDEIKSSVDIRVSNNLKVPHLAAVLVGDDGPSQTYVNSKIKACERVGFESSLFKFQKSISEVDLMKLKRLIEIIILMALLFNFLFQME